MNHLPDGPKLFFQVEERKLKQVAGWASVKYTMFIFIKVEVGWNHPLKVDVSFIYWTELIKKKKKMVWWSLCIISFFVFFRLFQKLFFCKLFPELTCIYFILYIFYVCVIYTKEPHYAAWRVTMDWASTWSPTVWRKIKENQSRFGSMTRTSSCPGWWRDPLTLLRMKGYHIT
jgi:hypothetical protein